MIFYSNIQIPRISGNFDACADSVYQALFPRKKGSLGSRLSVYILWLVKLLVRRPLDLPDRLLRLCINVTYTA